ncbi:MAG: TonB-dependent receptor [Myxococcales bacterium]|nr:TonB-dependent receptor [Myxococcales bacterium]
MRSCFVRSLITALVLAIGLPHAAARADEAALLAKEHYRRGTKLFDLQKYSEAAAEYERAYDSKEIPALLYNIGQAYRFAGEHQKSLAAYRSYLRHSPDAPNRAEVNLYIEEVKKALAARLPLQPQPGPLGPPEPHGIDATHPIAPPPAHVQAAPVVEPPKLPPADPRQLELGRRLRYAGIGTAVVGVAGLVLGGVFAGLTVKTNDQLNHPAQTNPPPPYDKSLEQKGRLYQNLTPAMFAVGGVALAGGIALFVVGNKKVQQNRYALLPAIGPGHVAATFTAEF